ncbi:high choriolytic enzyme 2-like [Bufo bufo]|uniref:high choriolytic enzyme 2-like n=1 Tax=Bufo bufo TaxID=8384 RepID=UPI001ABEA637|nr:high choriolytic enzyme 2-like [Bufo bufo]
MATGSRQPEANNPAEESSGDGDDTGMIPGWFDRISAVNNASFFSGSFVIRHLDIAVRIGRSSTPLCQYNACLWPASPDGFVYIPYTISSDFGTYETAVITAALNDIGDTTCIHFRPRTSETDYVTFTSLSGCWSSVGRIGGQQFISLERPDCVWSGVVTHEVLHALGLQHEHVRNDRNDYVQVQWKNINAENMGNFYIAQSYNQELSLYDYGSIMHYSQTAFSIDGVLPTLIAIPNSTIQLGRDFSMSDLDIVKLNTLYKCNKPMFRSQGCGGNLTGSLGSFATPNFPNNYPNNARCHWNITANIQFIVTFTDIDIEGDGKICPFDKLKIYNGWDFNTLYQMNDLCGKNLPSPITSYTRSMQFVFTSDSSVAGKGFRVVYQTVQN